MEGAAQEALVREHGRSTLRCFRHCLRRAVGAARASPLEMLQRPVDWRRSTDYKGADQRILRNPELSEFAIFQLHRSQCRYLNFPLIPFFCVIFPARLHRNYTRSDRRGARSGGGHNCPPRPTHVVVIRVSSRGSPRYCSRSSACNCGIFLYSITPAFQYRVTVTPPPVSLVWLASATRRSFASPKAF